MWHKFSDNIPVIKFFRSNIFKISHNCTVNRNQNVYFDFQVVHLPFIVNFAT